MSRIVIGSGLVQIQAESWTEMRQLVSAKRLLPQFSEDSLSYTVFALDGQVIYTFTIWKGAVPAGHGITQTENDVAKADFEAAMKAIGNASIISPSSAGDPTFTIYASTVIPALGKSMLGLWNGAASGTVLRLQELWLRNVTTTAITGVLDAFHLLRFDRAPSTTGTPLSATPHDSRDSLPAQVGFATGATIDPLSESVPLRPFLISSDEFVPGALDAEFQEHVWDEHLPRYQASPRTRPITVRPGQGLHLKCLTSTLVGAFDVLMIFTQG